LVCADLLFNLGDIKLQHRRLEGETTVFEGQPMRDLLGRQLIQCQLILVRALLISATTSHEQCEQHRREPEVGHLLSDLIKSPFSSAYVAFPLLS
jgi:hypothetical protein